MRLITHDGGHPGESMREVNRDVCTYGKITISRYGRTMQGGNMSQLLFCLGLSSLVPR